MSLLLLLRPSKDGAGISTDAWWKPYLYKRLKKEEPEDESEVFEDLVEEAENIVEAAPPERASKLLVDFAEISRKLAILREAQAAALAQEAERERVRAEMAAAEVLRLEIARLILMEQEEEEALIFFLMLD